MKRGRGEGYLRYPSPGCEWGFPLLLKRYCIDTTDFGFDQGDILFREGIPMASSGAMSSVWSCKALGSWVCFCLF
jgi:hypothetical protein